ncbi:MAG: hypothetical protein LBT54_00035 [Bifidobacteriaceae bacterium]|nr:hypothetical protein [Bifidobacteriaceae bacterium]
MNVTDSCRSAIILAAGAAAILTGCAQPDGPPPSTDGVDASSLYGGADQAGETGAEPAAVDPLTEFLSPDGANITIERATHKLTGDCMAEQGFEYSAPEPTEADFPDMELSLMAMGRSLGPSDAEEAEQYGYHGALLAVTEAAVGESAEATAVPEPAEEDPAYSEALYGEGGCLTTASAELAMVDDPTIDQQKLQGMFQTTQTRSEQDPELGKLAADWSACMAESGFDYAAPWEASEELMNSDAGAVGDLTADTAPGSMVSLTEREIALADVACKAKSDFASAYKERFYAIELEEIAKVRPDLDKVKRAMEDMLAKAQAVLAEK